MGVQGTPAGVLLDGTNAFNDAPEVVTAAGAILPSSRYTSLGAGSYAVTLPAPNRVGQIKVIEKLGTGTVTMALTNVVGGSAAASASFGTAGNALVLVAGATKWIVLKEYGVTLS